MLPCASVYACASVHGCVFAHACGRVGKHSRPLPSTRPVTVIACARSASQARGLNRLQARALLLEGWARSALADVPSDAAKKRAAQKAVTLAPEGERIVNVRKLSSI